MNAGSALLGLAIASSAISAATAADLPTKPAVPIRYVGLCGNKISDFVIPGDNSCAKLAELTIGLKDASDVDWLYTADWNLSRGCIGGPGCEIQIGVVDDEFLRPGQR
jgi:hypothetical protein